MTPDEKMKLSEEIYKIAMEHTTKVWNDSQLSDDLQTCAVCNSVKTNGMYMGFPCCSDCVSSGRLIVWLVTYIPGG